MPVCVHITVGGKVQGVGFRWFVAEKAHALALEGFVRNLGDGSVQIEAEGEGAALEHLLREVHAGPPGARVAGVRVSWSEAGRADYGGTFQIR
ncbi:MAG: acylphosphatase [Bacteroidota bacterium]